MTDIAARIAEGRRLLAQVSPAPWKWRCEWEDYECHDAALIARMRNEYAALLDVVEAAQGVVQMPLDALGPLRAALAAYARAGGAQ